MKTNQLPNLSAFTSKEDYRHEMNCILIDGIYAVASDAHILVRVDISDLFDNIEAMNDKMIHYAIWSQMRYAESRTCDDTGITCRFSNYTCKFTYSDPGVKYPDYKVILNRSVLDKAKDNELKTDIGLSPALLAKFRMITDKVISFRFVAEDKNVFFANEDVVGLIMPALLNNGESDFFKI
jgi:hypothetical protein